MARYSAFLGRSVEVHYRAGDILLPASGTFVADSGRSIFLEQHLVQRGLQKQFRWEIPYQYIVSLHEKPEVTVSNEVSSVSVESKAALESSGESAAAGESPASSRVAKAAVADPSVSPLRHRPKTA